MLMRVGRLGLRAYSFGRRRVVHAVCVGKPDNHIMFWYNGPLRMFLLISRNPITEDRDHRRLVSIAMASYRGRENQESEGFWEWGITWMHVLSQFWRREAPARLSKRFWQQPIPFGYDTDRHSPIDHPLRSGRHIYTPLLPRSQMVHSHCNL